MINNVYNYYSENRKRVFISTPLFKQVPDYLKGINYDFKYSFMSDGIIVETAIQMIPEIIDILVQNRQAIYQVIVLDN